ncbi:MAG: hypothetical protein ACQSGP_19400 [Frankia sp.]
MIVSLRTALEEFTLLVLPHGGQRTARRNAWRAAFDGRPTHNRAEAAEFTVAPPAAEPTGNPVAAAASR